MGSKPTNPYANWEIPHYTPSIYDAPASADLYNLWSDRAHGVNVGFSKDDLDQMYGQAIDTSALEENDLVSRGAAGRRMTGDVSTGGMANLRDKAIIQAGMNRSNAMRDISINNAVLKRQEISQGMQGYQGFLNSERANAHQIFADEMASAGMYNEQQYGLADWTNQYNASKPNLWKTGGRIVGTAAAMYAESQGVPITPQQGGEMGASVGGAISGRNDFNYRPSMSNYRGGGGGYYGGGYYG